MRYIRVGVGATKRTEEIAMPARALHFCNHLGCSKLVTDTYCIEHAALHTKQQDKNRGTASERGYGWRWQQYSKAFLRKPENQIYKLHLPGCTILAQCVDHIDPPEGPDNPRFWEKTNHQASCIHCNSVKGHRKLKGKFELGGKGV